MWGWFRAEIVFASRSKPDPELLVLGEAGRQHLDRDLAVEAGVLAR